MKLKYSEITLVECIPWGKGGSKNKRQLKQENNRQICEGSINVISPLVLRIVLQMLKNWSISLMCSKVFDENIMSILDSLTGIFAASYFKT